jgi:PAS domain S-box-containing protein
VYPLGAPRLELDAQRHALLLRVADLVRLRREPGELFREMSPQLCAVVPFDFVNFARFDQARRIMKMYLWGGAEWPREPLEVAVEEAAVGWAWQNQTGLSIDDLLTEERFELGLRWLREHEIRSYCVLPLTAVQERLGALGFASKLAGAFSPDDAEFLRRVADLVALCADHTLPPATLVAERERLLRQHGEQTRTLQDFSKGLVASGPVTRAGRLQGPVTAMEFEPPETGNPVWFGAALLESEQLLTAYFRASRVGLCILDTDFRYLAINHTLAEMNGMPAAAHLGKSVREMLGDFAELIEPQFARVLATQQPILNLEISCTLQNRTELGHWIEHYIPIKDATGKIKQIGVVAVEITEQKKLEESLRSVSETLREEQKRQQVMMEVSRVLAAKWDVRQVFPRISAYLRRLLRQEYAVLAVARRKEWTVGPAGHGFSPAEGAGRGHRNQSRKGSAWQSPAGACTADFHQRRNARVPRGNCGPLTGRGSAVALLCSTAPAQGTSGSSGARQHPGERL